MRIHQETAFFRDRSAAGRRLGEKLAEKKSGNEVVFAVPRGGIPVAIEVAGKLDAPLDVIISRKITIPSNPEAGYGAVTEDGAIVLNEPLVRQLGLSPQQIEEQAERVRSEITRRADFLRNKIEPSQVEGKNAILVDDGLASGFTMLAAVKSLQKRRAARTVVAVPVASSRAYDLVKPLVDDLVCLVIAHALPFAVASFYYRWYDLADDDVDRYLTEWNRRMLE
jgi:putative phosphoribosyl transferase